MTIQKMLRFFNFPRRAVLLAALVLSGPGLFAQPDPEAAGDAALPLGRIALFSSGVGFFEHSGRVSAPARLKLPFDAGAVNDALKSLIIAFPAGRGGPSPWVHYPSEETLYRTLRSFKIDLSGNPDLAAILRGQRGAEVEISAPNPIRGRILGLEFRASPAVPYAPGGSEPWLTLSTDQGIRGIALGDISSLRFTDPQIHADLDRALDLIQTARSLETRELTVEIPGRGARELSVGYVIPAPVWKAAYRLDLSGAEPLLQGWALVDNDGDTDWVDVELSLVTGRPVSFIQNLYAPYHLIRPELPLAIAGTARARTYDSAWGDSAGAGENGSLAARSPAPRAAALKEAADQEAEPMMASPSMAASSMTAERAEYGQGFRLAGGSMENALAGAAGEQFEFTLPRPISLARRQSAMLPLVEGVVGAERILVFAGDSFTEVPAGTAVHPAVSAELTNTTGMRLPPGPITVFDGGTYGGDALLAFFPENERRIISYGEDLSVTGTVSASAARSITAVRMSGGIMTLNRTLSYERIYNFRSASSGERRIILEHPITPGTSLAEPADYRERTGRVYRFEQALPAGGEGSLRVREESPTAERITLTQLRLESLLSYVSNQEIPADARALLVRAVELKRGADAADQARADIEARRSWLITEQDRIRRNLEAAGNQSPQGQEYLKRLSAMDGEIDALTLELDRAARDARSARESYENYLGSLEL
jgi:hypothetical protein